MPGCPLRPGSRAALVALLLALGSSPLARAQQPTDARDAEAAEVLFRDGKALFDARKFPEACPKLAESQRLDPAGGTLLLLALCYEGEGKTASAWSTFNEAAGVARRDKRDDRETRSQEHIAALEPRLSKLTVTVSPALAALDGLVVRRNGKVIPRAVWGSALPVDPGAQHIEALAPGKKPWIKDLVLSAQADRQTLEIGALEDLPAAGARPPGSALATAAPPPSAPPLLPPPGAHENGTSSLRLASYVVGAVGLVALGGGIYFGVRARNLRDESDKVCGSAGHCPIEDAVTKNNDARSQATWATAGFGLGAAGLVGGVVLFALSGSSSASSGALRVVPTVGSQGGGFVAQGGF